MHLLSRWRPSLFVEVQSRIRLLSRGVVGNGQEKLTLEANRKIDRLLQQPHRRYEPLDLSIKSLHLPRSSVDAVTVAASVAASTSKIIVCDDFIDINQCNGLCRLIKNSQLVDFISSPGERILSADSREVLEVVIGEAATGKLEHLREKLRAYAESLSAL